MADAGLFRSGERVWFRGALSNKYSLRGVIEEVKTASDGSGWAEFYLVRLENGNLFHAKPYQVRERGDS